MEVKPGYKQTEVGVIPEEWEVLSLAEVCSKITDGTHDTPTPVRSGVPFLTAIHIKENFIDYEACSFLTEEDHRIIFARCNPKHGDVLMVNIGAGVATTAFVDVDFEFSLKNVALLKPAASSASGRYLNQCLIRRKSSITQALSSGGAQPFLSLSQIGQIGIPVPPLPEQRAIAEALSDVDGLLGGLDRLVAKKRDLKQAAMQQLLTGQTRLPGFHGKWEVSSLDRIVTRATGVWGANQLDENHRRGVEVIRAGDISQDGKLTATAARFVSDAEFSKAKCELDDIVITTSGNGLGKVWWSDGRANVIASNFVRVLRPNKAKVKGKFLSYVLRTAEGLRQLQEHTATSAYPNLRPTFFSSTWILLPDVPEQTAIATVLSEMDEELGKLEERREKTRALKQAMMQELLTGKTRLV
jgi:type I restriction enzyme S subunit